MIVYKSTDGFAHDLRYENDDYVLKIDDIKFSDGFGELPELEELHDPLAVQANKDAELAEKLRKDGIRADTLAADLLARLKVATPEQISTFIDNNVVDLASARRVLKMILLVMALIANGS